MIIGFFVQAVSCASVKLLQRVSLQALTIKRLIIINVIFLIALFDYKNYRNILRNL